MLHMLWLIIVTYIVSVTHKFLLMMAMKYECFYRDVSDWSDEIIDCEWKYNNCLLLLNIVIN